MKDILRKASLLQKTAPQQQGVFSVSDLQVLLQMRSPALFYRTLKELIENGFLEQFSRAFYVTPNFNPWVLSMRLCPESYISLSTILAKNNLIGTISQKTLYAVKIGKGRNYQSPFLQILHVGITESLFFGFERKEGIQIADSEKAYLDTLYFYQFGHHFSFNVFSDIYRSDLDRKKLMQYLSKYKSPKFVSFVEGILE